MTSNCSRPMKWFETYVDYASKFHRASITASLHVEHVNTPEKMQDFADKLIFYLSMMYRLLLPSNGS